MSRCPFCDCQNPPGAKACHNCRAELPDADEVPPPPDGDKLADLIKRGEKIGAVKLYRERTGVGLKEAVDAIEAMQRGEQPRRHTAVEAIPAEFPDVVSLIEQGKKIAAIKLYREKTGAGLANSKAAVEALAVEQGITFPRSGCAGVVLACVVIGFVVARVLC
jgi:ribosomal protein L7/L12